MTAVEWLVEQMLVCNYINKKQYDNCKSWLLQEAKEMEKKHKTLLVEQLKDYTKEAQCILGNDEREASEFVEIFYKTTFKSE